MKDTIKLNITKPEAETLIQVIVSTVDDVKEQCTYLKKELGYPPYNTEDILVNLILCNNEIQKFIHGSIPNVTLTIEQGELLEDAINQYNYYQKRIDAVGGLMERVWSKLTRSLEHTQQVDYIGSMV